MHREASTVAVNAGQHALNESPSDAVGTDGRVFRRLMTAARVASTAATGVVVGELVGFFGEDRVPLVCFEGQPTADAVKARTVVALGDTDIGCRVVLIFESADMAKPIVMGALTGGRQLEAARTVDLEVDGEQVRIVARGQLVLRCGRASITLTKAGKILIHGEYISTRSNGTNRIRGGTVEIN